MITIKLCFTPDMMAGASKKAQVNSRHNSFPQIDEGRQRRRESDRAVILNVDPGSSDVFVTDHIVNKMG